MNRKTVTKIIVFAAIGIAVIVGVSMFMNGGKKSAPTTPTA